MLVLMAMAAGRHQPGPFCRRWLSGKGIFSADRGHVHHRLLDQRVRRGGACWPSSRDLLLTGAVVVLARTADLDGAAGCLPAAGRGPDPRPRLMGYYEWALVKEVLAQKFALPRPLKPEALLQSKRFTGLRLYPGDEDEIA